MQIEYERGISNPGNLFLAADKYDQRRKQGDNNTCTDQIVLASHWSYERVEGKCHGTDLFSHQVKVCCVVFVVHTNTL